MLQVSVQEEKLILPTYAEPAAEQMPMFAENRVHQRSTGNPYPNRIVLDVNRDAPKEKEYEAVRLENEYLRIILLPQLGGRIYSAYDKVNRYEFFYRQHVIKPALIGMLGSWVSGGVEFNWPCHHRPSTFMPTEYEIERHEDGAVTVWMSEHEPLDRMKGMVGVYLAPGAAVFQTRMRLYNRTDTRRSFLWWENAAVPVNEKYRIFFPHDVRYVQFHYRKDVTTYPLASGIYNGIDMRENSVDIRMHKNTRQPTSYFCGETKEDFFGGYDEGLERGVVHVADRYTSIGKKMFTWAYNQLSRSWENALTDTDGAYAELMASSYSSNQPDFAWLNPYETKTFTQSWYPIGAMGVPDYATYDAAVCIKDNGVTLQTTAEQKGAVLTVDGRSFCVDTQPCVPVFIACSAKSDIALKDREGRTLLSYRLKQPDTLLLPERLPSLPGLDALQTAQDCYLCGVHVEQYRDPVVRPDAYFEQALKLDPHHLPSLIALGRYRYLMGEISEALSLLQRAIHEATRWNYHMETGEAEYLTGLCHEALSEPDAAYDHYQSACWNEDCRAKALTRIARIDGRRGDYGRMEADASAALLYNTQNNLALALLAASRYRLGKKAQALQTLKDGLRSDKLDYLLNTLKELFESGETAGFGRSVRCDQAQTALDVAYDLIGMGEKAWALKLLQSLKTHTVMTALLISELSGFPKAALQKAETLDYGAAYPYRQPEEDTLRQTVLRDGNNAKAWFGLGCLLYGKRRYREAQDAFERAHSLDGGNAMYARCLAVCYFSHAGRREEALSLLRQALSICPEDQQLLYEIGYVMTRLGVAPQEKIDLITSHVHGRMRDDVAIELAQAYNLAGQYENTLKLMTERTFVPCEGGEHAVADQYMFAHHALARRKMSQGAWQEALDGFRRAQVLPQNLGAGLWNTVKLVPHQYYEAVCLDMLGRHQEAKAIYASICSLKKEYFSDMHLPELPCYQGLSHLRLGHDACAREMLIRFVQAARKDMETVDAGFFASTPFFISYVEDAKLCRRRACAARAAMGLQALGDTAGARRMLAQTPPDPANLFAKLIAEELDNTYTM